MDLHIKKRMKEIGGETVHFDVPMSHYTTLRTGGNVEAIYRAGNLERLKEMVAFLTDEGIPYLPLGAGSNLLVKDEGMDGVAIILDGFFASIDYTAAAGPCVAAGAGLPLRKLVDFCTREGLAGMEFLAGIPGTLGGAVAMNAGSRGEEIQGVTGEISVLTRRATTERRGRSELSFRYREVDLNIGEIILNAGLNLRFDEPATIRQRVGDNVKWRRQQFPLDMPSAGSIFKNPEGEHAGRLIDAVGLKGTRIGGAMISPKHANFIVNASRASVSDILALMDLARAKVWEMFNIQLVPEIKVVGKR
jgi:UDP-N-acetylmuramate dehydrogenase